MNAVGCPLPFAERTNCNDMLDTRDIAIATKTKVEALEEAVAKIDAKVDSLCSLADQAKGAKTMLIVFGGIGGGVLSWFAFHAYGHLQDFLRLIGVSPPAH